MLKNVYEGLNARPKVYLLKEYFCEMYLTCVSSKLCKFIFVAIYALFPPIFGGKKQTPPIFPLLECMAARFGEGRTNREELRIL